MWVCVGFGSSGAIAASRSNDFLGAKTTLSGAISSLAIRCGLSGVSEPLQASVPYAFQIRAGL